MPTFTDATGLLSTATALTAAVFALPPVRQLTRTHRAWVLVAAAIVALAPVGPLSFAAFVRGIIGDLSITTTVLLLQAILGGFCGGTAMDGKGRLGLQVFAAVGGSVLYPFTLGLGPLDPYRLGYADPRLMGAILLVAIGAWLLRLHALTLCVALAVLAYAAGWYESNNLWDYLLDPLLWIFGLSGLLVESTKVLLRRRRRSGPFAELS
jgi:hypothetical protein